MATEDQPHTTVIRTDEPVSIHVGESTDARWFRLFHAVVESGLWARIPPAAAKVLVVLAKHADQRWVSWPNMQTIAHLAGLTERGTYKAIVWLEAEHLVVRRTRGGGAQSTTYQLKPPPLNVGSGVNAGSGDPCTPVQGTPERGFRRSRLKELDNSNSRRRARKQAPAPAAAGSEAVELDPAILDALTAAEIGEPARSRLAALEGMSIALVERTVRKCQDKPSGVLIRALEAAAEATVVRRRRAAERRAREGVGVPPAEEPEPVTGEAREQGLQAMREALGRRMSD